MQKKLISIILIPIILGYIIFEEIVWERFAKPIFQYIRELNILQQLETHLHTTNKNIILIVFILLFVSVELLGLAAAGLLLNGKVITGVLIYATKIPVSALTFWIFQVTKKKLMKFEWFKHTYQFIMKMIGKITSSHVYLDIKARTAPIKSYIRSKLISNKGSIKKRIELIYRKLKSLLNKDI